jgi:hypothetical protein
MLILAAYLLVGVFVLRMVVSSEEESVGLLFSIPIAMIALALGMRAGIAAALLCLALMGVYDVTHADDLSWVGYATRGVTFVVLGGIVGAMTSTLDIAYQQAARRGEPRHSKDREAAEVVRRSLP